MISDANILEIDLKKIRNNIKTLKKLNDKEDTKFFAVVKANAYGLGAVEIAKYVENDIDAFCVSNINEAIELRENGIKKDVLILGYVSPKNYLDLNKYNLITTIYDLNIAKAINSLGILTRVHIKIETGHNRLGFKNTEENISHIKEIFQMKNISVEGIFSHLSSSDEKDHSYTNMQVAIFNDCIEKLKPHSNNIIKHISNDAAIIAYRGLNYDAVRSGISMYGVYPSDFIKENYNINLEFPFKWKSKISFIKKIKKGEAISYGRKFIANKDMKIATISVGYADGYHRLASNRGYVLINDKKANIVGAITMDQMMVDVTNIRCNLHDDVILIGGGDNSVIEIEELAKWNETITYEIMTSISNRVSRIYLR